MAIEAPTAHSPGLFYPDISANQGSINLSGIYAVCIKRSEGTYYLNPDYEAQVAAAKSAGAFQFAYHFLTNEDPAAQASFCFDHVGPGVGLMVDVETEPETGSKPTLQQNVAFVTRYRALGGQLHLNYLPQWYWSSVWGGQALAPLKNLGLALVSSDYAGYATNAGWGAYGGWHPTIWQYSSTVPLHGLNVNFNVYLGSGTTDVPSLVSELKALVHTGALPSQKQWQELETTGGTSVQQTASACGMDPAAMLRATAVHFGRYDPVLHDHLDKIFAGTLDPAAKVPAGARLWVLK